MYCGSLTLRGSKAAVVTIGSLSHTDIKRPSVPSFLSTKKQQLSGCGLAHNDPPVPVTEGSTAPAEPTNQIHDNAPTDPLTNLNSWPRYVFHADE
jgi:hypothetical protein